MISGFSPRSIVFGLIPDTATHSPVQRITNT